MLFVLVVLVLVVLLLGVVDVVKVGTGCGSVGARVGEELGTVPVVVGVGSMGPGMPEGGCGFEHEQKSTGGK